MFPFFAGLFQRVIVHSGSPLAFWATTDPKWPQGYNTNSSSKQFDSCSNKTFKACLKMLNKSQLASIQGMVGNFKCQIITFNFWVPPPKMSSGWELLCITYTFSASQYSHDFFFEFAIRQHSKSLIVYEQKFVAISELVTKSVSFA